MIEDFRTIVWQFYAAHGRHDLPWRQPLAGGSFDPYRILVSEIMLQQTQVSRVIPKYQEFLSAFPDARSLAAAPLGDVLKAWQGLGYNRRAKFLWLAAGQIVKEYEGVFPESVAGLVKLPGVGVNTAGAVVAYAFNQPAVFIETNIRTVFIHHFFADATEVSDADIRALVRASLPEQESPREWCWALMDYGTHLKQTVGNLNKLSKSYTKQSAFEGSRRQVRGHILRMLSEGVKTHDELYAASQDERLDAVLHELKHEGLIVAHDRRYSL